MEGCRCWKSPFLPPPPQRSLTLTRSCDDTHTLTQENGRPRHSSVWQRLDDQRRLGGRRSPLLGGSEVRTERTRGRRKKALGAASDRSILVSRVVLFESSSITPQSPRLAPPFPPLPSRPLSESSRGPSSLSSHCRTISFRLPSVGALLPLAQEREDGKGATK